MSAVWTTYNEDIYFEFGMLIDNDSNTNLCVVMTVNAMIKLSDADTVAVLVTVTFHWAVWSNVAKVTCAHVWLNAAAVLTALSADRLTQTPAVSHNTTG